MNSGRTEHAWVLARLDAYAAGWLDEREEARLLAHLDTCESCRDEARQDTPLGAAELESARHLPPTLLANWKTAALSGLERDMVNRHLARCAACRHDLALLGFAGGGVIAGMTSAAGSDPSGPSPEVATVRRGGGRWLPWALGGWAAAASLVAVTLAVRLQVDSGPTMTPAPGPELRPAPGSSTASGSAAFARSGRPVRLASPERGAGSDGVHTITLEPHEPAIRFVIEPLIDVPPEAMVLIRLLAADGTVFAEIQVPHREAVHPDRGVLFQVPSHLPESDGAFTLTASAAPGTEIEAETASYRIRLIRKS